MQNAGIYRHHPFTNSMYGFIKADLWAAVVLLIKWETCTVRNVNVAFLESRDPFRID